MLCRILQTLCCYALEFQVILLSYAKSIKHCLVWPLSFHVFWGFFCAKFLKTFLCAIFQPKGADRKHKTDREKMDKRTEAEKVNCNICNICNICSLYPNKKLIDVIHWYANIIGSDVFFFIFWINQCKMCHSNTSFNIFSFIRKNTSHHMNVQFWQRWSWILFIFLCG